MGFFKQFARSTCLSRTPLAVALGLICAGAPPPAAAQPFNTADTASTMGRVVSNGLYRPGPGPFVMNPTMFFSNADPYWDTDTPAYFDSNPGDQTTVADAAEKRCDSVSGNPVMLTTGNKIESHIDFVSGGEMPLTLERSYNRFWSYKGLFGINWVSSYDYSLNPPNAQNRVWIQRPDGRRIPFIADLSNRWYEDKPDPIAYVEVNGDFTQYTHYTEAGGIERYNQYGYPISVHNRHGIGWTITYGNFIGIPFQEIRHTSGRKVTLFFDPLDRRLTSVSAPNGQTWSFSYDLDALGSGRHRLREVSAPGKNATITRYHYEKVSQPDALTGVSYNGVSIPTRAIDGYLWIEMAALLRLIVIQSKAWVINLTPTHVSQD